MTVYYISTTQSSNLVVSIVEHVYRMIALLLYITSRNSSRTLILSFICNFFVLIWGYSWRLYINAVWSLSWSLRTL